MIKNKKVLVLGGGHSEIPIILAAKKRGYYVITTGNQVNGLGHRYADEYCVCDFSDKEAILALAKSKQVEGIISGCNDFALLSAAYACEKLGLPGHDSYQTSIILHHKDKYREFASAHNIHTPKAIRCFAKGDISAACTRLRFPVIVKPVDLTGGKGIKKCNNIYEVEAAYDEAIKITREKYIIIEEFITGTNHGFSAYIQDQRVTFFFADNEQYYLNKYLVAGASTPTDVNEQALEQLCSDCEKIASTLKLVDGIVHIQFIMSDEGPVIIEICRRAPGDLYIKLVEMATGIDYPGIIVDAELGRKLQKLEKRIPHSYWVRHCVMTNTTGTYRCVEIDESIKDMIVDKIIWAKSGEIIENPYLFKAGIIFLNIPSEQLYREIIPKLNKLIKIRVD